MQKRAIITDFPSAIKIQYKIWYCEHFKVIVPFVHVEAKEKPTTKQYHNNKHPKQYLA